MQGLPDARYRFLARARQGPAPVHHALCQSRALGIGAVGLDIAPARIGNAFHSIERAAQIARGAIKGKLTPEAQLVVARRA
jgi:hypothetical protein